jgi:FEZ-like protein
VRDELEYEKELKNTFISLLLSIQSRRRQCLASSGGAGAGEASKGGRTPAGPYKYLTTVIPYQPEKGSPCLQTLQVLVKILKAINEDSPAVPALLTDYILKVLCPS